MDGEFIETPCQNFEEVPQTIVVTKATTAVLEITRPPLKMASLKDARAVIEEGGCTIWGQLPDIPYKSDKFGLGFTSGAQKAVFMLVPEDHHYALATIESTLWRKITVIATWTSVSSQLSTVDSTIGEPRTLFPLLSSRSNCVFVFWDM